MDNPWREIHQSLLAGVEVAVATIVGHSGSTPRGSGSRMLVYSDGRSVDTIGGGPVEADVIRTAQTLLTTREAMLRTYDLNSSADAAEMGVLCGGRLDVLIEYYDSDDITLQMLDRLQDAMANGKVAVLAGALNTKRDSEKVVIERSVKVDNEQWHGPFELSAELREYLEKEMKEMNTTALVNFGGERYILDAIVPRRTVYLLGGGHVARELAPLLRQAGFRIVVIDDRALFANTTRFPEADKVQVCEDYSRVFEEFHLDTNSYVIIVTRGHSYDKESLAQALRTKAGFIGMIGSRKKREQIYRMLQSEGFTFDDLQRVHCPIGLAIGAETPFEIAVSILAELIAYRARSGDK
jgi:xanthine dehydrogenase accessory factor